MKLTFSVLFACWTIYSSSKAVLSLPPSLIANAASLQPHHDHHQHHEKVKREDSAKELHKDVADSSSSLSSSAGALLERAANNEGGSIVQDSIIQRSAVVPSLGETIEQHQRVSRMAEISSSSPTTAQQKNSADERALYDLSEYLQAMKIPDETSDNIDDDISHSMRALHFLLPPIQAQLQVHRQPQAQPDANEFFTPLKHWARHCQPDSNCPPQYYRALSANRNSNNATASLMHLNGLKAKDIGGVDGIALSEKFEIDGNPAMYDESDIANNYNTNNNNNDDDDKNNDVFIFLNGEQDLIRFLRWAMHLLYQDKNVANYSTNSAEYYHPGMYIWKKLNLSGRIEPPFFAEEPHYVIVRREQLNDDIKMNSKYNKNDPFIPPRGRKHNMPDLDALLHRYETFVPNRGKRDKIKDMLKSNDLFFPNRGKKLRPTPLKRDFEYENGRLRSSNGNTKATAALSVRSTNDVGRDESKSFSGGNVASGDYHDNDDDNDWNKALPMAVMMRDVLEKLMREEVQRNGKNFLQQLKAGGNKITTNAHEINYLDKSNNRPQWFESLLNYKLNGFDPSDEQSMPVAVAINGETREMSTPQKLAALLAVEKDHALHQLQIQQPIDDDGEGDGDVGIGVDRGGQKIASNRWHSTRSMEQRQRQKERIQRFLQQRRLMAIAQNMNEDNVYRTDEDQKQQYHKQREHQNHHHHQVKSFTDPDPLLWPQLQSLQQEQEQEQNIQHLQQKHHRLPPQRDAWPQETPLLQSDDFDSPYTGSSARAAAISEAFDNDNDWADI